MEDLKLLEEWLANEQKLRPLLETMLPLLQERRRLEEAAPLLASLRNPKEVLPPEAPPPSIPTFPPQDKRPATLLQDNRSPLVGEKSRPVPTMEEYNRLVQKRKKANKRKHEKEKAKKAKAKTEKKKDGSVEMEEDPKDS